MSDSTLEHPRDRSSLLVVVLVLAVAVQLGLSSVIFSEVRDLNRRVGSGGPAQNAPTGLPAGTAAPSFSLTDQEGRAVALADFADQPLVILFSSPRCRYCTDLYPELPTLTARPELDGVAIVMFQLDSTPAENLALARDHGFDFPVLAADRGVFTAYEISGTPFATLVDAGGVIVGSGTAGSADQLVDLVGES